MSDTISEIKNSVAHKGKKMYQKEDKSLGQGLLTPPESDQSESEQIGNKPGVENVLVSNTEVAEPPKPNDSDYNKANN
jgi:hypothetical protein